MKDKINTMKTMLIEALLRDLGNEDKCTPGLYTVIRGILSDNKDSLDTIPDSIVNEMEESLKRALPFKEKAKLNIGLDFSHDEDSYRTS